MARKDSSGLRLFSFRQGDRSEYLALYALTRVAFVTPVPRQEDFGVVDFRCVLAKHDDRHVVPKGAFNVQVKSKGATLGLRESEIRWLSTNMDCPLFICVVDKKETSIKLYSCQNVWSALFYRMHPRSINLVPEKTGPNGDRYVHRELKTGDPEVDIDGEFDVFLGQPVIAMAVSDFEAKAREVFDVLDAWITLDRFNVALMRLGRAAAWAFESTRPNERPTNAGAMVFDREVNQHGLLDKICPILESLRNSYKRVGRPGRASEIDSLIAAFRVDIGNDPRSTIDRLLE
ncbi:MAG TPA: hypothetical protein VII15_04085 [Candidatus Cryosericum sp.]